MTLPEAIERVRGLVNLPVLTVDREALRMVLEAAEALHQHVLECANLEREERYRQGGLS